MKKPQIQKKLLDYITKNKWQYFAAVFSLAAGILFGAVRVLLMQSDDINSLNRYVTNFVSAYNLQQVCNAEIFKFSIYNNIKIIFFIWASGIWIGFLPLSIIQLFAKGYKLGLTSTVFVTAFKLKGVVFSVITILPQLLVLIPAITAYAVFNIKLSLSSSRIRGQHVSRSVKSLLYSKSLAYILAITAVALLSALIDAFVIPIVLKPVCSFLIR